MSQAASQSQDPSWVSIPFAKYSYNTSRPGAQNIPWTHIVRDDLNFVVRKLGAVDNQGNYTSRMLMKISAGLDELETQDLGDILACYNRYDPSSGGENPVRVVIRAPIYLAMIYPKSNTDVLRLQLKFFGQSDFDKAVATFQNLGFPTKSSPQVPPQPTLPRSGTPIPSSSSPAFSMLSTASGCTSRTVTSSISRPTSAMRGSPLSHEISFGQTLNAPTFKLPFIPEVTSSDVQHRSNLLPFSTPHNSALSALSKSMMPSADSKYGQDLRNRSSLYLSQVKNHDGAEQPPAPAISVFKSSESSCRSETFPIPSNERLAPREFSDIGNMDKPLNKSPFFTNAREEMMSLNQSPSSSDPFARLRNDLEDVFTSPSMVERPSSAPLEASAIQDLAIPPKRVLPFASAKKSRASSISDIPPPAKPTSVVKGHTIIKPPIIPGMKVNTPTLKPGNKRVAQRKSSAKSGAEKPSKFSDAPKLDKSSTVVNALPTVPESDISSLATKSAATRPSSAASAPQSKVTATKKRQPPSRPASAAKRPKMVDQGTQTTPYVGHMESVSSASNSAAPLPEDYLASIDKFVATHRVRPPPRELYNSPEYQDASYEEREILVNNFICENLQNPNFIQLCKDVSNSWRRIGFGM